MGDELAAIRRPFGPDDLRPELVDNGVDKTILVQTISSVDETREFLDTAAVTDFIAGVVGWVDLTSADVADEIASLVSDLLVGIRHQVHDEPDPRWLLRDDVQRGIAAVAAPGRATAYPCARESYPPRSEPCAATAGRPSSTATPPSRALPAAPG